MDLVPRPIGQLDAALAAQYRLLAIYCNFTGQVGRILDIRHGRRTMILLDPCRFLNRLAIDLILVLPQIFQMTAFDWSRQNVQRRQT